MNLKHLLAAIALAIPLTFNVQTSSAAETGWLNGFDSARAFFRDIKRAKQIPTRIKCRDVRSAKGLNKRAIEINITYRPNPKGYGWGYAWGQSFGPAAKKWSRPKWKLVSQSSFRRQSGLLARCGIWHRAG